MSGNIENEPAGLIQYIKNSSARRKLQFGDSIPIANTGDISTIMSDMVDSDVQRAREEYEFDLVKGEPLANTTQWDYSVGSIQDGTPNFYLRAPHTRPSRAIFRPIQATSSHGSAFHTPLRLPTSTVSHQGNADEPPISPSRISRELFPPPSSTVTIGTTQNRDSLKDGTDITDVSCDTEAIAGDSRVDNKSETDSINNQGGSSEDQAHNLEASSDNTWSCSKSNTRKRQLQTLVTDYFPEKKRRQSEEK